MLRLPSGAAIRHIRCKLKDPSGSYASAHSGGICVRGRSVTSLVTQASNLICAKLPIEADLLDLGVPQPSGQIYLTGLIDLRLLLDLSHRPNVPDPRLRGARPYLHIRDDLIALAN